MEMKNIYELWDRFEVSSVGEMELDMNGVHFVLKKNTQSVTQNVMPAMGNVNCNVNNDSVNAANPMSGNVVSGIGEANKSTDEGSVKITAPLVGTFYLAASPDADPFVKVGDRVNKGDVVCIIEAMKLMNEVKAPQDGIVKEILAEDAGMVEYGQVLITLE